MNFTDVREAVNFTYNYGSGERIENGTYELATSSADYALGDNVLYNETEVREFTFVVNYKNETRGKRLLIEGLKCFFDGCGQIELEEDVPIEDTKRYWSDTANWPNEELPKEGDDVFIEQGWDMILDIAETPILNSLEINGILTFNDTDYDITLNSHRVYVRAGELHIGNETHPYSSVATIVLHGD
jgi:hypothetical protein